MKCRSPPRSAARTISTICIPAMPAMSASASTPKLAERIRDSDLVIALGARLGEITTARLHAVRHSEAEAAAGPHLSRIPRRSAGSMRRRSAIGREQRGVRGRDRQLEPKHRPRADALKAAHADYLAFAEPTRSPGDVQLVADRARSAASALPDDAIICQRRRQLCRLGAPLLALSPVPHRAGADLGLDGLRPAGGGRGQAAASGPHGRSASPATAASR